MEIAHNSMPAKGARDECMRKIGMKMIKDSHDIRGVGFIRPLLFKAGRSLTLTSGVPPPKTIIPLHRLANLI